ncbi:MAG: sodium-dependent transporter, partial [Chlamydiota bacterium]
MSRERWPSSTMFIFAAIGSAVGLGNIWRFPFLVGKYGGGAFLLPYCIMLFLVGFPLLILEFSIGQKMQLGAVGAFKKVGKNLLIKI